MLQYKASIPALRPNSCYIVVRKMTYGMHCYAYRKHNL